LNITVDYREKASGLIDLLKTENISIEVKKVLYGDYIINTTDPTGWNFNRPVVVALKWEIICRDEN